MDLSSILISCCWVGLFSGGLCILLTAPVKFIFPGFLCGFTGRLVLMLLMNYGVSQNFSTVVATCIIVLLIRFIIRRDQVSPVVLISGILPLGPTVAVINAMVELMKVSSLKGEMLTLSTVALTANMGKVFTVSISIVVGLVAGIGISSLFEAKKERQFHKLESNSHSKIYSWLLPQWEI